MPRNSSGTYTLPAGNPVVTGTLIESTWANPTMSDIGSAITDSLDRFGRGGMLAPMRFTDGTVTAPSMSFSSETTLGIFRPSAGTIALAVGGVSRFVLTAALLTITPPTTFSGAVTFNGGATLTGPIVVDKLYSNANAQAFTAAVTTTPDWQMAGTTAQASFFGQSRFAATAAGPAVYLGHSRGAAVNTQTIVQNGDQFAQISFFGSDGVSFREGARIVAEVDGTPGVGDMPGRFRFLVSPDGGASPVEALRIAQTGSATFAAAVLVAGTIVAQADATVATTLNVAGNATLQQFAVIGANTAIPSNTRVLIDRIGSSVLPALTAGTVLTLAGSAASGSTAHLQLISGNTANAAVFFGDSDAASRGAIIYGNTADSFTIQTATVTALTISSTQDSTFAGSVTIPNGTAAAPSLNFASSLTTGFYRQGADVIGFATAGVERWRMNATGILSFVNGTGAASQSTRVSSTGVTPIIQWSGTTLSTSSAGGFAWDNTSASTAPYYLLARSRGAAVGTHTIVQNGDALGRISVAGSDGTQFTEAARISFEVDGTPGANDMPGRIVFLTTPDGASAPTTVLTLGSDNGAAFTSGITATTLGLIGTTATPLTLNRTGAASNCSMAFTTTSGSVFIGHGPALGFAVGGSGSLAASNWFNVTSTLATFSTNLTATGNVIGGGSARFNGSAQGQLGVIEGTGSGGTANTGADTAVFDSSASAGITILSPNNNLGNIFFGDPDNAASGRVAYNHTSDQMNIGAGGASSVLLLTSSTVTIGSGIELLLDNAGPTSTLAAGWRGVPQNSRSAAYTLVLADAGKHIYHPSADTTARIFTIPANGSVAFPIGTPVTFVNDTSAGTITIAITTDTLVQMGTGATGSRTLAANGIATAVKVTATRWVISGTNLT